MIPYAAKNKNHQPASKYTGNDLDIEPPSMACGKWPKTASKFVSTIFLLISAPGYTSTPDSLFGNFSKLGVRGALWLPLRTGTGQIEIEGGKWPIKASKFVSTTFLLISARLY